MGPSTRANGNNNCELKYNGTNRFPIEFLKELSELQQTYYPADIVKRIWKTEGLTANGAQLTSKQWFKGLDELGIIPMYTAIRNPQTNLAERVNRQLGNLFRIFVGDQQHTKWSKFINTIECCINEVYHDTIEVTPYEAHHGRKPNRVWENFLK